MSTANKKDKRTESLTDDELQQLKYLSDKAESFTAFSLDMRVERVTLSMTMLRGSCDPLTARKIRKSLKRMVEREKLIDA